MNKSGKNGLVHFYWTSSPPKKIKNKEQINISSKAKKPVSNRNIGLNTDFFAGLSDKT
jgi:hypothetical protein